MQDTHFVTISIKTDPLGCNIAKFRHERILRKIYKSSRGKASKVTFIIQAKLQ